MQRSYIVERHTDTMQIAHTLPGSVLGPRVSQLSYSVSLDSVVGLLVILSFA